MGLVVGLSELDADEVTDECECKCDDEECGADGVGGVVFGAEVTDVAEEDLDHIAGHGLGLIVNGNDVAEAFIELWGGTTCGEGNDHGFADCSCKCEKECGDDAGKCGRCDNFDGCFKACGAETVGTFAERTWDGPECIFGKAGDNGETHDANCEACGCDIEDTEFDAEPCEEWVVVEPLQGRSEDCECEKSEDHGGDTGKDFKDGFDDASEFRVCVFAEPDGGDESEWERETHGDDGDLHGAGDERPDTEVVFGTEERVPLEAGDEVDEVYFGDVEEADGFFGEDVDDEDGGAEREKAAGDERAEDEEFSDFASGF